MSSIFISFFNVEGIYTPSLSFLAIVTVSSRPPVKSVDKFGPSLYINDPIPAIITTPDTTNGLYGVKSVRINIYDVSGEAASTENIVPSFGSTSQRDIVGVVATDGYIQSANLSLDRSEQSVFLQSITGDPDNTRTLSILSF